MDGRKNGLARLLGAGLLLGSMSCAADGDERTGDGDAREPPIPVASTLAGLQRASDCDDLLTKIQNDAIAKLKLTVERTKRELATGIRGGGTPGIALDAGSAARPPLSDGVGGSGNAGSPTPTRGESQDGDDAAEAPTTPTTASGTNTQVAGVDEADFVKVVESGKSIFLLHGNTLRKLKSWPARETALVGEPLVIEGSPSEMFVTESGKVVVFSALNTYGDKPFSPGADVACARDACGSSFGASTLKITIASAASAVPVVERELYYDGSYVSSRRYAAGASDVVRAVIQADSKFSGLFSPEVDWHDAWGRAYDDATVIAQLDAWQARTIDDIRGTALSDWLPGAQERIPGGALTPLAPRCGDYFVPVAGVADYGLTHVVSLDLARPTSPVGGVTILGATSTVYSNAAQLVLAQPDYRWNGGVDFGVAGLQQTALHVFSLSAAATDYLASGWVPGHLPLRNPQFGIDVAADGVIRVATTGQVRDVPANAPTEPTFWRAQHTENYVITARASGSQLAVVGKTPKLGHEGESVYAARFVGDRAYVVTFRQTDPLIVVDLKNAAAPSVLGEIEIPGFSEYMHPLDQNHVITVGQSASWGIQLQLFDVTNPKSIPAPKLLDLGSGSSSAVSYQHKAFTFFDGVLAIPVSGYATSGFSGGYRAALQLVRVDATAGFTHLGTVDHAPLYASNGAGVQCGRCDMNACYDYACSYAPEVRRGHFVKSEGATYVYSFSHAGVLVNDLADLAQPVARVGLPVPTFDTYGGGVPQVTDGGWAGAGRDGGVAVTDAAVGMGGVRDGGSSVSPATAQPVP
jgi:hypothetical protein